MNKLNSFLAAGFITIASAGLAATPVLAADPMTPSTGQQTPQAAPATPAAGATTHMHKHVNRAARVERVQKALNNNGATLKVDGKWGPQTKAAVMNYQKAHSLKATGRLDKATRAQLLKA